MQLLILCSCKDPCTGQTRNPFYIDLFGKESLCPAEDLESDSRVHSGLIWSTGLASPLPFFMLSVPSTLHCGERGQSVVLHQ